MWFLIDGEIFWALTCKFMTGRKSAGKKRKKISHDAFRFIHWDNTEAKGLVTIFRLRKIKMRLILTLPEVWFNFNEKKMPCLWIHSKNRDNKYGVKKKGEREEAKAWINKANKRIFCWTVGWGDKKDIYKTTQKHLDTWKIPEEVA